MICACGRTNQVQIEKHNFISKAFFGEKKKRMFFQFGTILLFKDCIYLSTG